MEHEGGTPMRSPATRLRYARSMLRFMKDYFRVVEHNSRNMDCIDWRQAVEDVSHNAVAWCDKGLKESSKKKRRSRSSVG